ncbi:MAG: helicase [Pseudonocardiales bacterium]|nr:helicase [Pseudonocardiales bacterium]
MRALIARSIENGGLAAEDLLAALLPMFGSVARLHEGGQVAPLRGLGSLSLVDGNRVEVDVTAAQRPRYNRAAIEAAEKADSSALEVDRGSQATRDLRGGIGAADAADGDAGPDVSSQLAPHRPVMRFVAGWQRWEHLLDHHDELTDIASLGELLAALACGLDLADTDDAVALARNYRNLFALNPRLHPVIAAVASAMIAPDRRRREQDLAGAIERLATYRDQPEDFDLEGVLGSTVGIGNASGRREAVLTHLRDRLFDLSKRNLLLYYRPTQRSLNLTEASVPLVLDVRNVRPEQLFTWGGPISDRLVGGKVVDVGSVVRWDDAPYASAALDALIATARRDRAEYGQDQLRLVTAFLRWHNLKDDPTAPIRSPLLLAPATLSKQRGVRDSYRLQLVGTDAEVNPVLRHQLDELYGFRLPESIDLSDKEAIESLRRLLQDQARATQPGLGITLVDRPRIELVRHQAQVAMQAYRRRRTLRRPLIGRRQYAYSYRRPGWTPLGIQIFRDRIQRAPIPLSVELGDRPAPRGGVRPDVVNDSRAADPPPDRETDKTGRPGDPAIEAETYSLREGEANPYAWDIDLCAVTLANFNYRTLSLVRDYDALTASPRENAAFDELFSTAARDIAQLGERIPMSERYLVVPADESQLTALSQARADDNFVIQGPPGTGKSQTITNLIADYVARGQRVLFVCQKRAALDVVHARLRAQGLEEICTLVHDSQQDKKGFVHALRDTYERWLADVEPVETIEARRQELIATAAQAISEVLGYERALGHGDVIDTLEQLIALRDSRWGDDLDPPRRRLLPSAAIWMAARRLVDGIAEGLVRSGESPIFARSPARLIDPKIFTHQRPDAEIAVRAQATRAAVDSVLSSLRAAGDEASVTDLTLTHVVAIVRLRNVLGPIPAAARAGMVDRSSPAAAELRADVETAARLHSDSMSAATAANGWHNPLGVEDARAALEVAQRRESSIWKIFSGDWRRVHQLVGSRFGGPDRQLQPSVTEALERLVAQHDCDVKEAEFSTQMTRKWGHPDPAATSSALDEIRAYEGVLGRWRDQYTAGASLPELSEPLSRLQAAIADFLLPLGELPLRSLIGELDRLTSADGQAGVRAITAPVRELAAAENLDPGAVLAALRGLDAPADAIEYAVMAAELQDARADAPALDRIDGTRLADLLGQVTDTLPALQKANAEVITGRLRTRFNEAVAHSQLSVTGMDAAGRERKKIWTTGRRELEHEFGKVKAYKSIRQLASAEPGSVVATMRPVWLMSPSSLSDTLPLDAIFDVVIFDEASQIPVEEAVPALFRSSQVIVVGDRMQLPPTQYFRTAAAGLNGTEDDANEGDDDETQIGVVLDADSFLAVSSVRLPSTMLTWHYRSRHEALIQFSNAAFYEGRLATIPDRTAPKSRPPITITVGETPAPADVALAIDQLFARSISHHRVLDGVYRQRTNPAEATWIAHLVREILGRDTGQTIGIVAFSEAQQGEIERALERLGSSDDEFGRRYEAELNREEDGQAIGLFVKNLENVQGDERDVIIMSVCYGAAPDGRMRMNFGPINNAGGEKRLNVIFSRARHHMVIVASVDPTAITNVYNDGANTLRNFLRYAEAVSVGDPVAAAGVLGGLRARGSSATPGIDQPPIVDQVAIALRARGLEVRSNVGQSAFRCDLALRVIGADGDFTTAVLVDHRTRLEAQTIDERRLTQPAALRSAGWRVAQVLATEWESHPTDVVDRLVELTNRPPTSKGG